MTISHHQLSAGDYSAAIAIEMRSNPHALPSKTLNTHLHQFKSIGAFDDDRLIAFVILQSAGDEVDIIHLVCDKTHHNQGIMSQLMKTVLRRLQAQSIQTVFLEVRRCNQAARNLYYRLGFRSYRCRKQYYSNRQDAILMQLSL